jgi:Tfp pilus assembly protein PilN
MIRINLLPEEYRRKSRTPLKLMAALSAVVAVNTMLAAWLGWLAFGVAGEIESQRLVLQLEMDGLTPQVTYFRALEKESKQYKSRETTLAAITKSRVVWTRKLDELMDVVNRGDEGQRHLVWFDDLTVTTQANARDKSGGSLRASGHSGSDKFAQVANFLEDLESSTFVADFHRPAPPEGTQTVVDESLVPPVVWAFPLQLTMKTTEEREAAEAAAKDAAAKEAAAKDATKAKGAKPKAAGAKDTQPKGEEAPR